MFRVTRYVGSRFPRLKPYLLPIWKPARHASWKIRNIVTRDCPIHIAVGDKEEILLYPEGQIAELMWGLEFERKERDFVTYFLKPGMRVVNIGANIGLYTIMSAALVSPDGVVHAFEPSQATFERLNKNIELNSATNVFANKIALSDEKGSLLLKTDPKYPDADGHRFVEKQESDASPVSQYDEVVQCDTLDDHMRNVYHGDIPPVDFMIIDVEGAEWSVLKGALHCLAVSRDITLLLECTKNRQEVESLLTDLGFDFFEWDPLNKAFIPCDFMDAVVKGDVIVRRT